MWHRIPYGARFLYLISVAYAKNALSGADPGGSSGGSDESPLAPKITHSMCLSDLL